MLVILTRSCISETLACSQHEQAQQSPALWQLVRPWQHYAPASGPVWDPNSSPLLPLRSILHLYLNSAAAS